MDTELECKFIKQNHDEIRKKLVEIGAECFQKERIMTRANYDFPDDRLAKEQKGWVRIRDEGDKITLSYKQSDDVSLHGMQEVNIQIDSFENAQEFLQAIGVTKKKAYQETKRESWLLEGVQIELDTWPWIEPFVELEAPNEKSLDKVIALLGYDKKDALHGSVIPAYQAEYDITPEEMANWPEYLINAPVPAWFEKRRKLSN
ncbi:CYTH domain-containing protein [Candidatus Saccharibacteria bacterium]|jgi:adenylate cyclase class 2|nr:CYTH domain-containing protein [Candidatus Saccharibacteria bacterium]MBP7834971.1 CYTH domain-containing protein [Candidatus Saccharibacteria bacterium]